MAEESNLYETVVEYEREQANIREPSKDAELYINTCKDVRKILGVICKLKCAPTVNTKAVKKNKFEACVLTSVLKRLNRLEKVRLSASREAIQGEKQKVESTYMQYQNLLYEVQHYNSEYNKCIQYRSGDDEIDLITTTEYLQQAPSKETERFYEGEVQNHQLYLARLDFELKQRIYLAKLLEDLKVAKKQIKDDIVNMKKKLAGVEPKLQAIVQATKPLQDHLELAIGEVQPEHRFAAYLPDPLYLFYCNAYAYSQFVGGNCVVIEIEGKLNELEQYNEAQKALLEDAEEQEQSGHGNVGASKKHRRRKGGDDSEESRKKSMLMKHPLCVKAILKSGNVTLTLKFIYLPYLRIVTVMSATECALLQDSTSIREVLSGESILSQLYAHDTGTESPNLVNNLQLKQVGIDRFKNIIPQIGYAYNWTQKLCGLEFLNCQNFENRLKKQDSIYIHTVENAFTIIKHRLKMRSALAKQLVQLELNLIPLVPDNVAYPKTSTSALSKFISVGFQRFCQEARAARALLDRELIASEDLYFLATISHPKAVLNAWIVIKNEYPEEAPMIFLHVQDGDDDHHNENCEEIRDMECHINTHLPTLATGKDASTWLLAVQLKYLCAFLDVYLETGHAYSSPTTIVFFRKVLGRNRRRPYKFHKAGNGVFTHY